MYVCINKNTMYVCTYILEYYVCKYMYIRIICMYVYIRIICLGTGHHRPKELLTFENYFIIETKTASTTFQNLHFSACNHSVISSSPPPWIRSYCLKHKRVTPVDYRVLSVVYGSPF